MRPPTPAKGNKTHHLRRLEGKAGAETTSSRQGVAATVTFPLRQGGVGTAPDPHRHRLGEKAGVRDTTMSLGIAGQRRTSLAVTEPTEGSLQKTHDIVLTTFRLERRNHTSAPRASATPSATSAYLAT